MTKGQSTVLGLLVVLLALEALRSPNVRGFLQNWLSNFKSGLNSTTQQQ